jgi:hypothetical protein
MLMNDNGITREMTQEEIDAIMAEVPAPVGYEETDEPIED